MARQSAPSEDHAKKIFSKLPERITAKKSIPSIVDRNAKDQPSDGRIEAQVAKPVPAQTEAHPNSVKFRTDDNVDGKRKVTIDAIWKGDNSARKNPLDWGIEISLYQWNYKLSQTVH